MAKRKKKGTNITGFFMGFSEIGKIIEDDAKKHNDIIYGAKAMNRQLPGFLRRGTIDYDIFSRRPKRAARRVERKLDRFVGADDFYVRSALYPGTWKVMHEGVDGRKRTRDDIGVADYTKRKKVTIIKRKGQRYETVGSIGRGKRKILKDPKSRYRHRKDRRDLARMKLARLLKRK